MAGHSQFKNIMHRKGRQDKARSKLFSKLAREITVSAKLGQPDPAFNPRLRAAMLAVKLNAPRGPFSFNQQTQGPIHNVYIREVAEVDGRITNRVIHTYKDVAEPPKS